MFQNSGMGLKWENDLLQMQAIRGCTIGREFKYSGTYFKLVCFLSSCIGSSKWHRYWTMPPCLGGHFHLRLLGTSLDHNSLSIPPLMHIWVVSGVELIWSAAYQVCTSFCEHIATRFCMDKPRDGIAGFRICLFSTSMPEFPKVVVPTTRSPAVYESSSAPHPHLSLVSAVFCIVVILVRISWYHDFGFFLFLFF